MNEQEQMEFFYEIFDASLPRLGPGDDASTTKALRTIIATRAVRGDRKEETEYLILDLGCGNGAQAMQLAMIADGTILAVDNCQSYLDELNRRAKTMAVSEKMRTCLGDMHNLKLDEGTFDLIWSEGALYIMGFRNGLESCFRLLAPGGAIAVTELCWLRPDAPDECQRFFESEYPVMVDVDTNLATIAACGYELLGHFTLPETSWWEQYYIPLEGRLSDFRGLCAADPEKLEIVEWVQSEIGLYRKYSSYYGYVFFMMQR